MDLATRARGEPRTAIFARNFGPYLDTAAGRRENPTTFATGEHCVSAKAAWEEHGSRRIYVVPIQEPGQEKTPEFVEYVADLIRVEVDPVPTAASTALLDACIEDGQKEYVRWIMAKGDGTVYQITRCQCLERWECFPFSKHEKLNGTGTLSARFQHSYSLVLERPVK